MIADHTDRDQRPSAPIRAICVICGAHSSDNRGQSPFFRMASKRLSLALAWTAHGQGAQAPAKRGFQLADERVAAQRTTRTRAQTDQLQSVRIIRPGVLGAPCVSPGPRCRSWHLVMVAPRQDRIRDQPWSKHACLRSAQMPRLLRLLSAPWRLRAFAFPSGSSLIRTVQTARRSRADLSCCGCAIPRSVHMAPCGGSTREGDIYVRVLFAIRQVMMYTGEAVDAQDGYLVPRATLHPWRTSTDWTGGLGYLSDCEGIPLRPPFPDHGWRRP